MEAMIPWTIQSQTGPSSHQPCFSKGLCQEISGFLSLLGFPSYAHSAVWVQIKEYPTYLHDDFLQCPMSLEWSAIESFFKDQWVEAPIFQWHKAVMCLKYPSFPMGFVYSINLKDLQGGLNPQLAEDDAAMIRTCSITKEMDAGNTSAALGIQKEREKRKGKREE